MFSVERQKGFLFHCQMSFSVEFKTVQQTFVVFCKTVSSWSIDLSYGLINFFSNNCVNFTERQNLFICQLFIKLHIKNKQMSYLYLHQTSFRGSAKIFESKELLFVFHAAVGQRFCHHVSILIAFVHFKCFRDDSFCFTFSIIFYVVDTF